ncbi:MAG: folylpolyglutamate synthase/dihydrofolate synthase family protein [Victivallaceae bacterium]|nr:folylpolyglutamate synthase/dihydrofolate synthase family protein [Victivallaceae bacterium]
MDFSEAAARLETRGMFGITLGLERARELFDRANIDAGKIKFLHIAGTNGKGSVGAMLQGMLRTAGYRTGFYSSPHLLSVRERFRMDGLAIPEARFSEIYARLEPTADAMKAAGREPTYFELVTALAAAYFIEEKADFAVWETGMGGRLDATNIVTPEACIITNVALDHCEYLGNTVAEIAAEKAGIIKPGVPVFGGCELTKEALDVIRAQAAKSGAPFEQSGPVGCLNVKLPLAGPMQRRNYALAELVLKYLSGKYGFDFARAARGVETVGWPGRMQRLRGNLWVDGGHNPDGAAAVAETFAGRRLTVVFGAFRDKEAAAELQLLEPVAERFVFVPVPAHGRPSHSAEELGAMTSRPWSAAAGVREAVESAGAEETVIVTGSLYLVGETLRNFADEESVLNI